MHKFALYFCDFYGEPGKMTIALRMDRIRHEDRVISLEEALADKLKYLLQRHSSKDLFDLA